MRKSRSIYLARGQQFRSGHVLIIHLIIFDRDVELKRRRRN